MTARIILYLLICSFFTRTTSASEISDRSMDSDTVFELHHRILVLFPNLKVETNTPRHPGIDFVEAELSVNLDYRLHELLASLSEDSLRVISNDLRNSKIYKDDQIVDIAPDEACKLLRPDAIFMCRYHFINMPTLQSNQKSISHQLSELRAEFTIYDCQAGKTVWTLHHSEFVPTPTAGYNELMKKMYGYLVTNLPYRGKDKVITTN